MQTKTLDEAIDEILESIVSKLRASVAGTSALSGIKAVVRGDRARPRPQMPSIFVYPDTSTPEHPPMTLAEKWVMPVILVCTVQDDDPERGYRNATSFAAKARSAVLRDDRTLGLRNLVQDVRSGRFEPSSPLLRDGSLFGAAAVVEVVFTILEP